MHTYHLFNTKENLHITEMHGLVYFYITANFGWIFDPVGNSLTRSFSQSIGTLIFVVINAENTVLLKYKETEVCSGPIQKLLEIVLIPSQNLQNDVFKRNSTQIESFKPDILTWPEDRLNRGLERWLIWSKLLLPVKNTY